MQIFLHIITKVHNIQKYDYLSALESDQKQAENRNIYPWIVTTKVKSYEFFACGQPQMWQLQQQKTLLSLALDSRR